VTLTHIAEEAYERLYRFALSLSKCPSDASDLVQQTYWKWAKHRDQIRSPGKARSWLFTTLYREFLKDLRRQDRVRYLEDRVQEGEIPDIGREAGSGLDGEMAMRALQQVPDPYRASLTLFYVEDMSYVDISNTLEIPPGTVMSRIYRGKQLLKKMFEQDEAREQGGVHAN
jgi:RNA polymerase sigma factor (sigma-70 family)